MAAAIDVPQKQRAAIEFLCCENTRQWKTFTRGWEKVCGDDAVDRSTVSRWATRLSCESGHPNIRDFPCSGTPHCAYAVHLKWVAH